MDTSVCAGSQEQRKLSDVADPSRGWEHRRSFTLLSDMHRLQFTYRNPRHDMLHPSTNEGNSVTRATPAYPMIYLNTIR